VAAEVQDVIDVLDVHRALAHAGAAGHAVPGHLLEIVARGDQRTVVGLAARARGKRQRTLSEQVVAHAHDQQLG
jgi:hypothetical protein